MRRAALPDGYRSGVFPVRGAPGAGIARNRLRAHDLETPIWGTRRADRPDDAFRGRLEAYAARLRSDVFFSHATAARLHGIPLPLTHERDPDVHIAVHAPSRAPHATGIRGHRLHPRAQIVTRYGLRVTSACDTWRDLGSVLTMIELVAAGDHIIHHRAPVASSAELAAIVRAAGRCRGVASLRAALEFLDDRAESPPESELRVILALGGLPPPRINYEVVQTERGHDARVDFAYDDLKFAIEYQGDYHRSKGQWRKDMTRRGRLEAQGWYVMEVNADDLRDPGELTARIHTVMVGRR